MVERETNPQKRKLKFWQVALVILGLLAVLFGVYRVVLRAKLQDKLATVRAGGYPITLAEMDDWYAIPAYADNAADYITGAFGYLQVPERRSATTLPLFGSGSLPPRTEPMDEQTLAAMAQVVQDNQVALELLHKAAAIAFCRYPADFKEGQGVLVSHLGDLRNSVQGLCLQAVLQVERGEPGPAVDAVVDTFAIADSLVKEPLIISQLVRRACQARTLSILERIMSRADLNDEQLARMARTLDVAYDPNAITRGFVGERCMVVAMFLDPGSSGSGFGESGMPAVFLIEGARALGRVDAALIRYIDLMTDHIETMRLAPSERVAACAELERQGKKLQQAHRVLGRLLPSFPRYIVSDLESMMQIEAARTAVAVQRYRLANGRLPRQLADLTPVFLAEVPRDAFTGQPLRYQKLGAGFVVYSVGQDRTDDGGQERQPRRSGQEAPYDITFIVER